MHTFKETGWATNNQSDLSMNFKYDNFFFTINYYLDKENSNILDENK